MFFIALTVILLLCVSVGALALALCRAAALGDRQLRETMDTGERGELFYPADAGD